MPSTQTPVDFQAIFETLKLALSDETLYLNRATGELELVRETSISGLCDVDEEAIPASERALIQQARQIISSNDWVPLPGFIHEADFAVLKQFAKQLEEQQRRSLNALLKRSFSHPILEFLEEQALEEDWFLFRRQVFYQRLQDCLAHNEVAIALAPTQS